ncbi:MAG: NAD(P)H-hydrate epimerase, partial [Clostridia bacterium]|nr:NAD(P)H-hydrate epimerase [Clostridia bacterium]
MLPLLSPDQMYALEKDYFGTGAPSLPLMERAAGALVAAFEERFGPLAGQFVAVACGAGNNGGDGWAFARLAAEKGARIAILAMRPVEALSGDALICARRAQAARLPIVSRADEIARPDVWIDALFGIGLNRPVSEAYAAVIGRINEDRRAGSRVLAVDAPSGLDLATGHALGACVGADVTVTFEYPKRGHFLFDGLDLCGAVDVRPIGLGGRRVPEGAALLVQPADALRAMPVRKRNIHKGSCGHLLIAAGSLGMCGAAMYAARAALRMGTGLVTLAAPRCIAPILQALEPGAMCLSLPEENGALSAEAAGPLAQALAGKSAAIVGPGLGP